MNIRKIIKEEVDDFDWIDDIPSHTQLDIESLVEDNSLYTFYFYPSITSEEYSEHVAPVLKYYFPEYEDKVLTYDHPDDIDHVEVHGGNINDINAGNIYYDKHHSLESFLYDFGNEANDGNELFNIR